VAKGFFRILSSGAIAIVFGLAMLAPAGQVIAPAWAQNYAPAVAPDQLDALLAPVALYPDPLLAQILMASTYPEEVTQAATWQRDPANAGLAGDQLAAALQAQPWDPSIKALLEFPQVLQMMAANPQWLQQLGQAFTAQQADVAASVQRLRHLAYAAGTLVSTPQQTVSVDGDIISIEPASPQTVYPPLYDPGAVYGAWPYPDEPPDMFPPPPGYAFGLGIGFGIGFAVVEGLWGWSHWDWRRHEIRIDGDRYNRIVGNYGHANGDFWRHDWRQGAGVAPRFAPAYTPPPRQDFRGYVERGGPVPNSPPAFQSFGRGVDVRAQAVRGQQSRAAPPAPMRMAPVHAAPAPRGGGGGGGRGRR
jgi:hypothetical protein